MDRRKAGNACEVSECSRHEFFVYLPGTLKIDSQIDDRYIPKTGIFERKCIFQPIMF